jgi:transposase
MSYCEKYREAAVAYKKSGHTFAELKSIFKISSATYYKWLKYKEEFGSYVPPKKGKQQRKGKIDPSALARAYEEKPDAYLREIAVLFDCSVEAIRKRLKTLNLTLKKRHLHTQKKMKKKERST